MSDDDLLEPVITIARAACEAIMAHYHTGAEIRNKADGSPVTAADHAADAVIVPALVALTPDIPVISEERVEAGDAATIADGPFWLVDPLDGTREFISRNGDFTVNIGLVRNREPALGVVATPVDGRIWAGVAGTGAFTEPHRGARRKIRTRVAEPDALTVVASRSHRSPELEEYIAGLPVVASVARGSALKFCLVAAGEADLYPRTGPTMEWDTAAGHAIVLAAGGSVERFDGASFTYGKPDFRNGWFLVRGRNS
ncbi:MAG: 3'(2'),5'-bisphosphate nucleotidase CysQ [Alphaproteobacteria bacterium]|nr:3'(2'),5'-bisphosphate nucleotidase CysQ [Alphaproteobacteria bacterium]